MSTLNIIVFGGEKNLINKIFPEKVTENKEKREIRYKEESIWVEGVLFKKLFNKERFHWKAIIFPELNIKNKKELIKELDAYFNKKEKEIKKNIKIFFGDYGIKSIINKVNNLEQTKRPLILFISKNKGDYSKFSDIRLVTYLKLDEDEAKTYNKIVSYLWEKDCYFN